MIRHDALFRSSVFVVCLLTFFAVVMGVWLRSLQRVPTPNPIVSLKWIANSSRSVSNLPMVSWHDQEVHMQTVGTKPGVEHLWRSLDRQILLDDITTAQLSNDPISLQYIEFFAGREFGEYQFAAYRLLQQKDMFRLSEREYNAEMAYLFPELPINIQGVQGERLLTTTGEVVDWKTEVLQQQGYAERLRQYLAHRRFEERDNIDLGSSLNSLELALHSDWQGWILATGTFSVEGCLPLSFTHYVYRGNSEPLGLSLPWWLLDTAKCSAQYEKAGMKSLHRLEIKFTEDDGFLNPSSTLWRLDRTDCFVSSQELPPSCVHSK